MEWEEGGRGGGKGGEEGREGRREGRDTRREGRRGRRKVINHAQYYHITNMDYKYIYQ